MLFNEKRKSKIKKDIAKHILPLDIYSNMTRKMISFLSLGMIILLISTSINVSLTTVVYSSHFNFLTSEIFLDSSYIIGLFFFFIGLLKLIKLEYLGGKTIDDFKFQSKDLIYYISLSKEFKNKKMDNFILSELKKVPENKKLLMSKKIKDIDFINNFNSFNFNLKSKEEKNLKILIKERKEINQKIKESKKIIGKRINDISISND